MFVNLLKNSLEITVSHQTIENWLFVNENILEFDLGRCSGYYISDVEWIKINGEWKYRHTLLDSISNCIVADEIGVNHQLCTFHLFQTINHKLKVHCRRNKINKKQREHIYENAQELKNCFRQNSTKEAIGQFKQYLQNYVAIPVVLKDFIRKHIINHFHRYVQHLDDENIEKTSNKVENYYRQTNPEKIKKLYKTKNRILTFLDYQMENWTEKTHKNQISL